MRADIFRRLGGMNTHQPRFTALLQTDGSFQHHTRRSRVAMILTTERHNYILNHMMRIPDAQDSTETEWASINHGLLFALENNEMNIHIENDNLSVIRGLILPNSVLKNEYAKYHRYVIMNTVAKTHWTAIRWIPRELNESDKLFGNRLRQLR
jgi:ribonuclease HI